MAPVLVLDTAISTAVVALGTTEGELLSEDAWQAGYRHGEELLSRVDRLLDRAGLRLADLAAVVVGTGPGAFTGMRVGLATAKALAHGLGVPIVGVPSSAALLEAAAGSLSAVPSAGQTSRSTALALLLPAGPSDRLVVVDGEARLVPGGDDPQLPDGTEIVAVDLDGRATENATALGRLAVRGYAASLLQLGATRLRRGERDDVARLVPEYVTLPRGVRSMAGEVTWSRGRA